MLYYIEAKVSVKVQGISGPFIKNTTWLVNASNLDHAKQKFEQRVAQDNADAMPEKINFEYIRLAGEIQ